MTMLTAPCPPPLAQFILRRLALPGDRDAILGDMNEALSRQWGLAGAHQGQTPRGALDAWYWGETLRAIPPLLARRAQHSVHALSLGDLACGGLAVVLVFSWEFAVARRFSWPIAREVLGLSPLSAAGTCQAAYVGLHMAFSAALILMALRLREGMENRARRQLTNAQMTLTSWSCALTVMAALLPGIVFLIRPTPYDGLMFRLSQLAALACVSGALLWANARRHNHAGNTKA